MKLLEHLHGVGMVIGDNGEEIPAKYDVQITRDDPEAAVDAPPTVGFKHIAGRVWSERDPYFVLSHCRKILTLEMEDGRRFKFFHRDAEGNIGLNKWIG